MSDCVACRGRLAARRMWREPDFAQRLTTATHHPLGRGWQQRYYGQCSDQFSARHGRWCSAREFRERRVSRGTGQSKHIQCADRDLHTRGVHHQRVRQLSLSVRVPWIAVQHQRRSGERACWAATQTLQHKLREQRVDDFALTTFNAEIVQAYRASANARRTLSQMSGSRWTASRTSGTCWYASQRSSAASPAEIKPYPPASHP